MRLSLDKVSFSRFYSIFPVRIGSIDWYDCLGYFIVTFQYYRLRMFMEKFIFWVKFKSAEIRGIYII